MMNILLPTDFSENSRNAAVYAMQFFKDVPCTLHLLHVVPASSAEHGSGLKAGSRGVQEKFTNFITTLKSCKTNPEHQITTTCKVNFLIEAVRQQVLEKSIDLILMGTKGSGNKAGAVIGKNTADVMTKVKCPVLAISENAVYKQHKEILFPTDYKIQYNTKMLETLLNLTSLSKAQVKILELFNTEKEPSEEQLANRIFLQNFFSPKVPMLQTYYSSKVPDKTRLFAKNKNVDMIVMVAKNLNICQKLLKNQQNNQIPFINQLPLLVLHG
ncbi:universal stress protein [Salinimicrobium sp. GXAS 041]|uniref:universal stress protein n=1 Tax=Salinimicrobium sp. GXAS 041 TaxID=3400806 RepID=UPI003C77F2AF